MDRAKQFEKVKEIVGPYKGLILIVNDGETTSVLVQGDTRDILTGLATAFHQNSWLSRFVLAAMGKVAMLSLPITRQRGVKDD